MTINNKLNFNNHLQKILKKASQKVHVFARITPYMTIPKRKLLTNSFFISQFNYCHLVWMCHSRLMNNKINRQHDECLRIVYSDKIFSFEELLDKYGYVTIHTRNLQVLATEMFKVYKNLSPTIDHEITLKILEFILNLVEKVKRFYFSQCVCFQNLAGKTSDRHSFHLQNPGILQTRMDLRGDPMKMDFDSFQMQK